MENREFLRSIVRRTQRRGRLALAVASTLAATARATPPDQRSTSETQAATPPSLGDSLTGSAKEQYVAARILFDDKDYAGALVKFQHAFDDSGDVRLLWNMAVCEKNLRHYSAVQRLLDRYRRDGDAHMTDAERKEVNEVLETVRTLVSKVHVVVNEPGATVYVDDHPAGTTPLAEPLVVDLGKRTIRASKPGFKDQTVVQEFSGGSETTFTLNLVAEPRKSRLSILVEGGGVIRLDGKVMGEDRFTGTVPPGEHIVHVTADGKHPYNKDVLLAPGETREFHVTLESASGGIPAAVWIGASVVAAAGLGVGGYFLFRPAPQHPEADVGSLGQVMGPLRFR